MGFRKLRAKKYKSITEYYKDSDKDKTTIAHYISYWAEDASHKNGGTTKKERVETLDVNEALKVLNKRKAESLQKKTERDEIKETFKGENLTIDHVATQYFEEREKKVNIHRDKQRYARHLGQQVYRTTESKGGYVLTDDIASYTPLIGICKKKYYERNTDDKSMNIGSMTIKSLDVETVRQMILALGKKGLGAKSVSDIIGLFKAITMHAISEGYIAYNPFLNKKTKVKVPKETRKRLFTPQEIEDIFVEAKKTDERIFVLFNMLYYTAQRPKSILGLKVKDIDLNQRHISIDFIKGQSGTFVPISDKLYPLLEEWIKDKEPETKLFNVGYSAIQTKTKDIFKKYNKGLNYKTDRHVWASMYSFRHTSATVILAKTGNIKTAQTILNHANVQTTEIYAKLLNNAKTEGVNVL